MDDLLYQIITQCTKRPVIIAAENGKRPPKPFFSIESRTASALPSHVGAVEAVGGDFERSVSAHRDLNVSLIGYGKDCMSELDRIAQQLQTERIGDFCAANNVAIVAIDSLQHIPELQTDMTYENRAVLEFRFRYVASVDEQLNIIDEVHGLIDDGAKQTNFISKEG